MTEAHIEADGLVPEWDLPDRMTKALRVSGIAVQDMANRMGVSRDTIGRWTNGRNKPGRPALMVFASVTGVDLVWLETGEDLRACRDSNPKPSVWEPVLLPGGRSDRAERQARLDGELARTLRAVS